MPKPAILATRLSQDLNASCSVCRDTPAVTRLTLPHRQPLTLCLLHSTELRRAMGSALSPKLRYGEGPVIKSLPEFLDAIKITRSFWHKELHRCVPAYYLNKMALFYIVSLIDRGSLCYRTPVPKPPLPNHPKFPRKPRS